MFQDFIMEIYADNLKYFEPDTENKTNVPESIDKVKNNANDLKAQYIYIRTVSSGHRAAPWARASKKVHKPPGEKG